MSTQQDWEARQSALKCCSDGHRTTASSGPNCLRLSFYGQHRKGKGYLVENYNSIKVFHLLNVNNQTAIQYTLHINKAISHQDQLL